MTTAANPSPTDWALAQYEADCNACRKYEDEEGRRACVTCPTEAYRQATKLDETKRINRAGGETNA
ncbi:hypothetical protein [Tumebacillus permanentifrigoris]|uniref:Uncharacterized protein n=1 Tax=Tumebacillus permanentifrigoris TaxID=378543 RepID=A0A316D6B0_9BACL|nr:hypothetical protein [Tumebacillus permanentifrigoris]PWK10203.1 hypothetical protein C7459_11224 [Tumebacillus permanentifrigoris]